MNENIAISICIAIVCINAIWAYALWQINVANKRNKKVSGATGEILADRIFELSRKVETLQHEVKNLKANDFGWKWTETTVRPDNGKETNNE